MTSALTNQLCHSRLMLKRTIRAAKRLNGSDLPCNNRPIALGTHSLRLLGIIAASYISVHSTRATPIRVVGRGALTFQSFDLAKSLDHTRPTAIADDPETVPAETSDNFVACKMLNELITSMQAIARGDGDTGAALVNAHECFLIPKGTSVRVKRVDAEAEDPKVACIFIEGVAQQCLWMPANLLEGSD